MNDASNAAPAAVSVRVPSTQTNLKYEYGMELTWLGKAKKIMAQGEEKLRLAFPLMEEEEPEPVLVHQDGTAMTEQEVNTVVEEKMSPLMQRVLGYNIEELKAKFVNIGFSEDYATKEARRLARDIVLFDLGVLTEISPHDSTREGSRSAAAVRREAVDTIETQTGRRRNILEDRVEATNMYQMQITDRAVKSLTEQWMKVGYRDRRGVIGLQWNAADEIEITSPVHRTLEQARVFYQAVYHGFGTTLGLHTCSDTEQSGGGHLHVSRRESGGLSSGTMYKLCWELVARPYIQWAFNDPGDATEAAAPVSFLSGMLTQPSVDYNFRKGAGVRWANPSHRNPLHNMEDGNDKYPTTEFRIFEMPQDWDEQLAHIMFVEKWLTAIEHNDYPLAEIGQWRRGKALGWTYEKCRDDMYTFLTWLGLDWEKYHVIVDRNLEEKFLTYADSLT